jgi:hypothetical protein
VEPVAAGDRVGVHLAGGTGRVDVPQYRLVGFPVRDRGCRYPEIDVLALGQACGDQVLDHLGLRVDRDRPAGELAEVEVVALPGELQVDATVLDAFLVQPGAEAGGAHQLDRARLQQPGALARLDVLAGAVLDDDGLDAGPPEQMGQHQTGRARTDDRYLCPQLPTSRSTPGERVFSWRT